MTREIGRRVAAVALFLALDATGVLGACGCPPDTPDAGADSSQPDAVADVEDANRGSPDADASPDSSVRALGVFVSPFNDVEARTSWAGLASDLVDAGVTVFVIQATSEAKCADGGDEYRDGSAAEPFVRANVTEFLEGLKDAGANAGVYLGTLLPQAEDAGPNGSASPPFWAGTGSAACFTRQSLIERQEAGRENLEVSIKTAGKLFQGFYLSTEFPIQDLGADANAGIDAFLTASASYLQQIKPDGSSPALVVSPTFPANASNTSIDAAAARIDTLTKVWRGTVIVAPQDGVGSFGHEAADAYERLAELRKAISGGPAVSWINVEAFRGCDGGTVKSERANSSSFEERLGRAIDAGVPTVLFFDAQYVFNRPGHPLCGGALPDGGDLSSTLREAGVPRP